MKRSLVVVFATIGLDAVGIGLVFPILPRLLEDVTHAHSVAPHIGIITALYAIIQFIFAPVLGALSDHLGRRPVLLVSLAALRSTTSPWRWHRGSGCSCLAVRSQA